MLAQLQQVRIRQTVTAHQRGQRPHQVYADVGGSADSSGAMVSRGPRPARQQAAGRLIAVSMEE